MGEHPPDCRIQSLWPAEAPSDPGLRIDDLAVMDPSGPRQDQTKDDDDLSQLRRWIAAVMRQLLTMSSQWARYTLRR